MNNSNLANFVADPFNSFRLDKAPKTLNSGISSSSIQKVAVQLMTDTTIMTLSELDHVDNTSSPNNFIDKVEE